MRRCQGVHQTLDTPHTRVGLAPQGVNPIAVSHNCAACNDNGVVMYSPWVGIILYNTGDERSWAADLLNVQGQRFRIDHQIKGDAMPLWLRLGRTWGLAPIVEAPDGRWVMMEKKIGYVLADKPYLRGPNASLRYRRPRFLTRRKAGYRIKA